MGKCHIDYDILNHAVAEIKEQIMCSKIDKLPKDGSGKPIFLGDHKYYPGSYDGFAGPHEVEVIGIKFDSIEISFGRKEEAWWIEPSRAFHTEADAFIDSQRTR